MSPKDMKTKHLKWSREQIEILIRAYQNEPCLYASNSSNYRNKLLRSEALSRVGNALRLAGMEVEDGMCAVKFHSLRTQYNVEKAKVKSSISSGCSTDNIYRPSLWYFKKLDFLDTFYIPRKARNSKKSPQREMFPPVMTTNFLHQTGHKIEISESFDQETTSIQCTPDLLDSKTQEPGPSSEETAGESFSESPDLRNQKRTDENLTTAMQSSRELFSQPIDFPASSHPDPIDGCMVFLGSILRSLKSEELKLELMNNLTQTALNARSEDLRRSKYQ